MTNDLRRGWASATLSLWVLARATCPGALKRGRLELLLRELHLVTGPLEVASAARLAGSAPMQLGRAPMRLLGTLVRRDSPSTLLLCAHAPIVRARFPWT